MPTTSGSMSRTLVTQLNRTATTTTLVPAKITALPSNYSSWQHNTNGSVTGIQNSSVYWNATSFTPNCLDCYPNYTTIGPLLITYSYSYDYAYYAFLLILLITAIVCIKMGVSRRKELERRVAAQRRRARQQLDNASSTAFNSNNNSNSNNNPRGIGKEFDLPPTYDEVVQSHSFNKQSTPIDDPSGITTSSINTISASVSTLMIESEIPNSNHASVNCLSNAIIV